MTRKRYTFWITDVQAEGLKRVKESQGTSESEQIRQALNESLRKKGATSRAYGVCHHAASPYANQQSDCRPRLA